MGKRICILEDDPDIREIIEILLVEEQYEVISFGCVSDFIRKGKDSQPDLFLIDVMLPDGNGVEVCEILKSGELTKTIPVLMMSAHSDKIAIEQYCIPNGFIAKPFDIYDLLNKVDLSLTA